jgi:hypothetical protein
MHKKNRKPSHVQASYALILVMGVFAVLPGVTWNTFLGGAGRDEVSDIAVDTGGNAYIIGESNSSWGDPLNPFVNTADNYDVYIAKVNSNGVRQWSTFLGGSDWDVGGDIALDGDGNIYVIGTSESTWGTPVNEFADYYDVFVAKFNNDGTLQWNTFLGSDNLDWGYSLGLDADENIYVTGDSLNPWGTPLNPHSEGYTDAFAARLNSADGSRQWHTFLGGEDGADTAYGIAVSPTGNIYVTGESDYTWGIPVHGHRANGFDDIFVAKFNSDGALQWNTFWGGAFSDGGYGIGLDQSENVYITGQSWKSWGTPINPYVGDLTDAFVMKLNTNGGLQWNTFLGGNKDDSGLDIKADHLGNIYAVGYSESTWGNPMNPFGGYYDAYIARLNTNGATLQNTFLGGAGDEQGRGVAFANEQVYIAGYSSTNWGNPLVPHNDIVDGFVAKVNFLTTSVVKSVGAQDGWVLESSETSGMGGTINSAATTLNLGDNAADRQYRAILHFNTSALPDNAVITSAVLKIKSLDVTGTNPFNILGSLKVDMRKPAFGTSALTLSDFKSAPGKKAVATFGVNSLNSWYSAILNNAAKNYINRNGTTQFRLYFTIDDNNDNGNDFIKFHSGNAAAANQPKLIIEYYVPLP